MAHQCPLYQTEIPASLLDSGRSYKMLWAPDYTSVLLFHPQTDGQSERTIQTLEDMLRACVMEFKGSWDNYLAFIEFAYNNSYQSSIGMAPYEALYGRKCRTPICWDEVGERRLIGLEIVQHTTEKVNMIRERLKIARDRQKSYADNRRRDLQFEIGDQVFFKDFTLERCVEIWETRQA